MNTLIKQKIVNEKVKKLHQNDVYWSSVSADPNI
jgi:hypothetical protein